MWYCFNFNILFIHQFFGSSFLISDQMTDHQNPESAYLKSIWLFLVHLLSAFIRLFHLLMTFWNRQKSCLFCAVLCISAICSTDSGKDYKRCNLIYCWSAKKILSTLYIVYKYWTLGVLNAFRFNTHWKPRCITCFLIQYTLQTWAYNMLFYLIQIGNLGV